MFPADCLPSNYVEARTQSEKEHILARTAEKQNNKPTHLLQPTPQRPTVTRTLSSALMSFFPASSAGTSPAATPMPSPALQQQNGKTSFWFVPLPKVHVAEDIACLPPAWS